ncbi:MAG: 30S ribosomal protein S20 [bacterium]
MPNIKSAEKRLRQSLKRRDRNRTTKAAMRTEIKKADKGIAAGDPAVAVEAVKAACKALDTTAQKGVIHKNTASRKKSRLMKKLNTISKAK